MVVKFLSVNFGDVQTPKHCLTVDPTIDPTVEITGQPVSRTQASDASGRLPRYEAKCVKRTRFQWGGLVPLRADIKGTELPPANILIPLERHGLTAGMIQASMWSFLQYRTV